MHVDHEPNERPEQWPHAAQAHGPGDRHPPPRGRHLGRILGTHLGQWRLPWNEAPLEGRPRSLCRISRRYSLVLTESSVLDMVELFTFSLVLSLGEVKAERTLFVASYKFLVSFIGVVWKASMCIFSI